MLIHNPHLRMIHRKCDFLYVLRHAYIFVHVQDLSKTKWDILSTNMDRLNDAVHTLYTLYMPTTILSPSIYNSPFPNKLEILTVHALEVSKVIPLSEHFNLFTNTHHLTVSWISQFKSFFKTKASFPNC